MKIVLLIACCFAGSVSFSQFYATDSLSKARVYELAFLTGNWKGSGTMTGQDGKKHSFEQTENIQFKLDSTALLIEGLGMSNGEVIHNALAIVTYNKEEDKYRFQSYLQNGRSGTFDAELREDGFYWFPNENTQYVIHIDEEGKWVETGSYNRGGTWFPFFEMTLTKDLER